MPTSVNSGTLYIFEAPFAKRAAAINYSTAFFAPAMETSPFSCLPPIILIFSVNVPPQEVLFQILHEFEYITIII